MAVVAHHGVVGGQQNLGAHMPRPKVPLLSVNLKLDPRIFGSGTVLAGRAVIDDRDVVFWLERCIFGVFH